MSSFEQLQPPPTLSEPSPNILCYFSRSEQKEYLILAPHCKGVFPANRCYKYDFESNKWIHFTTYPHTLSPPMYHSATLDAHNELLYITHGFRDSFGVFNLYTNQWASYHTLHHDNAIGLHGKHHNHGSEAPSVALPNGDIHLLIKPYDTVHHIRYDRMQSKFVSASIEGLVTVSHCDPNNLQLACLVYVHCKRYIMLLGRQWRDEYMTICVALVDADNLTNCVWRRFPVNVPRDCWSIQAVVAFDSVLIISTRYHSEQAMYILDLSVSEDQYEWVSPAINAAEYQFPVHSMVVTKDNHLHLMFAFRRNNDVPYHRRIHLSQFLPSQMYQKFVPTLLIFGFVRETQYEEKLYSVMPDEIILIIVQFY